MLGRLNTRNNNPEKIALAGIKSGVGVTHTGILMAEFLKEQAGARVAFVEENHHGDMERLGKAIYGYSDMSFTFRGVDYYSFHRNEKELDEEKYDYLILDFGVQKKKNQEAIKQCGKKVIIGTSSLWEWQEYLQGAQYFRKYCADGTEKYVVTLGEKRLASQMEKMLRQKIYFLGSQPLGMVLSKDIENFFQTLV